jgi:hypothetical protein
VWLVVAAVALVAIVAGVGVLVLGGDGDDLDADAAAASLERMIDDPTFFSSGDLRECPLGDIREVEAVVAEHGDASALEVRDQHALDPYERMAASVECSSRSSDGTAHLEVIASRVPDGDYASTLAVVHIADQPVVEEPTELHGGDVYVYCGRDGCGADWVHGDDLVVGVYGEGLGLDADGAQATLEAVLPDLVASLAGAEAVYVE